MPDADDTLRDDLTALNELLVNCPEFEELERLLGGFNLFQVLKFEYGEIRHSNVLAWIMDPSESHGLGNSFLKRWLMRVIHECEEISIPITPVDIDAWQLLDVEVHREWKHIDLLLILRFAGGARWCICIENKVKSTQGKDQLTRYRKIVEEEFPDAAHRLYLFLTKNEETPADPAYIAASYGQIHITLKECLAAHEHVIGMEPKTLLENYIRLLEEKFMDQSKIAEVARRIYKQHRRALDVIFEHRPDNLQNISEQLVSLLKTREPALGIIVDPSCTKSYIRFIPKAWDHPGNRLGKAWSGSIRTVVYELDLRGKRPSLHVVSGMAPSPWIQERWERAKSAPFNHKRKRQECSPVWVRLHYVGEGKAIGEDLEIDQLADLTDSIIKWCVDAYQAPNNQQIIKIIAESLPDLEKSFTQSSTAA